MENIKALFDHILERMPDAARIELRSDNIELIAERHISAPVTYAAPPVYAAQPAAEAPHPAVNVEQQKSGAAVKSPIVGTYYAAPSPDAPPFVSVGQSVKKGQTLCIIEAMKMMNEIESEHDGVITEILAANGQLIEFGQTLFLISEGA